MTQKVRLLRGLFTFTLLALITTLPVTRASTAPPAENAKLHDLHPDKLHEETAKEVVARLKHHYRHLAFDDSLSEQVWHRYLHDLDPNHLYFLASDIDGFKKYKDKLDDQLLDGKLDAGYAIFNVYQKRLKERLTYMVKMLNQGLGSLDFEKKQYVLTDRSKAPWPKDEQAMNNVWRRELKNAVLSMRLNGIDDKEILDRLKRRYESQLDRLGQNTVEDVFSVYINALAETFDPHTTYFTPHNSENFDISMSNSLEGIGAVLQAQDQYTKVVRLVPGGPAAKAGQLQPADRIVGVAQGKDGKMVNVIGMRLDDVVSKIRGPKGTVVRLEVIPAGTASEHDTHVISITRNKVVLEEQKAQKKIITVGKGKQARRIGVIDVPAFYLDFDAYRRGDPDYASTTRDVARLLVQLQKKGIDGLIIDLRNNGGGSLQEAIELVSLFIDNGPTVQVRTADNHVEVEKDTFPGVLYSGPMAVLVNRFSASASEIFTGAMQDYHRALIVGGRTFGKGTVQSLMDLNHGQLKLTHAKFYRVSGSSNQHRGILPDLKLPYLVDDSEIGESSLPNSLPWDSIKKADYKPVFDLARYIPELRKEHQARVDNSPKFNYVRSRLKLLDKLDKQTELPLKIEARRKMQQQEDDKRLAIENRLRKAEGKKPLESVKELHALEEKRSADPFNKTENDNEEKKPDPYLQETGLILRDLINAVSKQQMAARDGNSITMVTDSQQ